jgi:ubiquinone/menaquinone biosynthesis C-methylase UbiE
MTKLAERLLERYFGDDEHPYRTLERVVESQLRPEHTLLDAGCGRTAPVLVKYRGKARRLIGVDLVDFDAPVDGVELINCDLGDIPLPDATVDIVMCRSVMEHIENPAAVYREMHRILKPGGVFVFLTGNLWDYAALIALAIPNRLHPWIVARTEGRREKDVFPIQYRTNTRRAVRKWASAAGFEIESFRYLGQYPGYFMFNGLLFLVATGYEKMLRRFESLRFLRGWIFVTLRKA